MQVKRIGILTFHRAENFGAAMQAIALFDYLKSEGYDVEIVDYRCKYIECQYDLYDWKTILSRRKNVFASIWNYFLTYKYKCARKELYNDFRNRYFKLSPPVLKVEDVNDLGYDAIIIGSDQVWNQRLTGGFDDFYWGHFYGNIRVISYAASSELKSISEYTEAADYIRKSLSRFHSISCREDNLARNLSKMTGISIEKVVDPTFLQSPDYFKRIAIRPQECNYILVYHLVESKKACLIAKRLSEEMKLPIIEIHVENKGTASNHLHVISPGPMQLVGYIANARYVLTTSFHGTALSILFKKQFFVVDAGNNLRMLDLLSLIGLKNRMINEYQEGMSVPIDYGKVWNIMSLEIERSKNFIKHSLC